MGYKQEFNKWQVLIDEIASNPHLTREKRAAAIAALRERQKVEATAVRKRIIKEEKQHTKAARRLQQHIGMN